MSKRPERDKILDGSWFGERFPNAVPTSVVLIVEYLDGETSEEHLVWTSDVESPIWKHLGMVASVDGDMRASLQRVDDV